jgi:putative holliday junction resolvase
LNVGRILAIDYGKKRVGLAVTDKLQIIANGLDTVPTSMIMDFLQKYFEKEKVDLLVIGYPKQMNNFPSEAVPLIDEFISGFGKKFPDIKYYLLDERFTSKMALQAMIDGGLKKLKRQDKGMIDKVSATILLQSYLEMRNNIPNFS